MAKPQIEVSFDIDANGILTVTAKDNRAARNRRLPSAARPSFPKTKSIAWSATREAHSDEDRNVAKRWTRAITPTRVAYQVERQLQELGSRVPLNEKARAEQLIAETRELVKNNSSDVAELRRLANDLQQLAHGLASGNQNPESAAAGQPPGSGGAQPGSRRGGDDDVIDAEFKQT